MDVSQVNAMAERWLAAVQASKLRSVNPSRILAPWDELAYFDLPTTTLITFPGGASNKSICLANPQRVVLAFACASGTIFVSPSPMTAVNQGIQLQPSTLPLIFDQSTHGPLAQIQWFGFTNLANPLIVIEVVLRTFGDNP